MSKILSPSSERIKEITQALMDPRNGVIRRLKEFRLTEKVAYVWLWAEDWPDPANQRYQPRTVAAIVAWAEFGKKMHNNAIQDAKATRQNSKNKYRRIEKRIEKIETTVKAKFSELSKEMRRKSIFKNEEIITPYLTALVKERIAKIKKDQLLQGKTRTKEKYLDTFCLDMKRLFAERTESSPNYQLIADLANLFNLSGTQQTYNSIYQRLYHLQR